jgi:HD superfamily phosphohydrolase
MKRIHEVRDPIHVFARFDGDERQVIDSAPVQRLRHIHQLAMSYLVYPGATHKRFEHSLGVMELAGRVFDVLTNPDNVSEEARTALPELVSPDNLPWWRRSLRLAALCHDLGHLPFSHAAERELIPGNQSHEDMTRVIVQSPELVQLMRSFKPPISPEVVAKIAVGPKHSKDPFSPWETLLSEVITDDAFGVDRMDYLLRDSLHTGVSYGRFDHYRLIDTLRIVVTKDPASGELSEPEVGVEFGGLHSATSLLLARFFMFSQVYFHPVRVVYDQHLIDFLRSWLPGGQFPGTLDEYLECTDDEVLVAIAEAKKADSELGVFARRISERGHFRVLYQQHPADQRVSLQSARAIAAAARAEFGDENVKDWSRIDEAGAVVFPVLMRDGTVVSSVEASEQLQNVPAIRQEYVFISVDKREAADKWLKTNREQIVRESAESLKEELTPASTEGGAT